MKISDPDIISFVDSLFGTAPLDCKVFGGTISRYRNQWNAVLEKLGIPCRQLQRGVAPGSLRGSGATSMYLQTENTPLICWRGRWARARTLEFYLQEVAPQVLHHSLSSEAQSFINTLNMHALECLPTFCISERKSLQRRFPRADKACGVQIFQASHVLSWIVICAAGSLERCPDLVQSLGSLQDGDLCSFQRPSEKSEMI